MDNIWLHRYALLVAASTLMLVIAGGLVTSNDAGLSVPDWPLSYGKLMPTMEGGIFYEHGHRMVATTVGLLMLVLAIWLWSAEPRRWLRWLGAAALGVVILQGVLGGLTVLYLLPKPVSIAHACLAQLFFSATAAIALFTSPGWKQGAQVVEDSGRPPLRWLAAAAPISVLAQLALGAAVRHKAFGIIPHVAGAMGVTALVFLAGIGVLTQYGAHPALVRAGRALMATAFLQVFAGIAAYISRITTAESIQPEGVMVLWTVVHVAVGALMMAASVLFAIQVARNVRRAVPV
jgi:cytochrome c oxidase assembly protein subunit 15